MTTIKHLGRNIRHIRLLRGMKQEVFAQLLGLIQQKVSRMEKQSSIRLDRLEAVAKILGVSVETIEQFDEEAILNGFSHRTIPSPSQNVREIIDYFTNELQKKEQVIQQLQNELKGFRSRQTKV